MISNPPITIPPLNKWLEIKLAYQRGDGSLRVLARRFEVSENSLEKRCAREQWRREVAELGGKAHAAAVETAVECGKQAGLDATRLVERTLSETESWLDRIEALAQDGTLTPDTLRTLVGAWRSAIETGRTALRLDEPAGPECAVQVELIQQCRRLSQSVPKVIDVPEPT